MGKFSKLVEVISARTSARSVCKAAASALTRTVSVAARTLPTSPPYNVWAAARSVPVPQTAARSRHSTAGLLHVFRLIIVMCFVPLLTTEIGPTLGGLYTQEHPFETFTLVVFL